MGDLRQLRSWVYTIDSRYDTTCRLRTRECWHKKLDKWQQRTERGKFDAALVWAPPLSLCLGSKVYLWIGVYGNYGKQASRSTAGCTTKTSPRSRACAGRSTRPGPRARNTTRSASGTRARRRLLAQWPPCAATAVLVRRCCLGLFACYKVNNGLFLILVVGRSWGRSD